MGTGVNHGALLGRGKHDHFGLDEVAPPHYVARPAEAPSGFTQGRGDTPEAARKLVDNLSRAAETPPP